MGKEKDNFLSLLKNEKIKKRIIETFESIDPKFFFDSIFKKKFFSEYLIPIGNGEKSDPIITLAKMINHLNPTNQSRVLEIGTGSGYSTAILSALSKEVVTIEFHEKLALSAKERLDRLKINNVRFFSGDINDFDIDIDFFDVIIILAACSKRPLYLTSLLRKKGLMVFPMGPIYQQQIAVLKNEPDDEGMFNIKFYDFCLFTPLRGMYE